MLYCYDFVMVGTARRPTWCCAENVKTKQKFVVVSISFLRRAVWNDSLLLSHFVLQTVLYFLILAEMS